MIDKLIYASLYDLVEGRVYPDKIPATNDDFPAISYRMVTETPDYVVCGYSEWEELIYQVDIYTKTPDERPDLAKAVFKSLDESDLLTQHLNSMNLYEDDTGLYRRMMRFKFTT